MPVRIHRSFEWVLAPGAEVRLGGTPHLVLAQTDIVEELVDGEWKPVPIFEEPKPEHPREAARRAEASQQAAVMSEMLKNMQSLIPGAMPGQVKASR